MTHLEASRKRFVLNMSRVANLVLIFHHLKADNAQSRDVLRAAVMLLHASLEDILRQLLLHRMPTASVKQLTLFFSDRRERKPEKMNVGDLASLHGIDLEGEIRRRMRVKLAHSNYNDLGDVLYVLEMLGFDRDEMKSRSGSIEDLIRRRHDIVHKSDREEADLSGNGSGRGRHGRPQKIDADTVESWLNDVGLLVEYVIANIDKCQVRKPPSKKSRA